MPEKRKGSKQGRINYFRRWPPPRKFHCRRALGRIKDHQSVKRPWQSKPATRSPKAVIQRDGRNAEHDFTQHNFTFIALLGYLAKNYFLAYFKFPLKSLKSQTWEKIEFDPRFESFIDILFNNKFSGHDGENPKKGKIRIVENLIPNP